MPRLLPCDALEGPPVRARWTAILAAALAITAWNTDWPAAWDTTRGLVPATSDRHDWNTAMVIAAPAAETFPGHLDGLTAPERARTAQLTTRDATLDLVWDDAVTITAVQIETYSDAYGTGHRLAIAMDATTTEGTACLNAALRTTGTDAGDATALQYCARTDLLEPPGEPTGPWRPLHFFLTQTANLDPAAYTDPALDVPSDPTLVDYFGFGHATGDSYDTGLWPSSWSPQWHPDPACATDPNIYRSLADPHLTGHYHDPARHGTGAALTHTGSPAYPVEDRLVLPACTPVANDFPGNTTALVPYADTTLVPLASWTQFNASTPDPQPLRTAVAVDVRSYDTELRTCSSDTTDDPAYHPLNSGTAGERLDELLRT